MPSTHAINERRLRDALKIVPSYLASLGLYDRFYRDAYATIADAAAAAVARLPVPGIDANFARGLLEMVELEFRRKSNPQPIDLLAVEHLRWLLFMAGVEV